MSQMTTRDLELIAVLAHARAPVARIAAALGISEPEYSAWLQRLALGRTWREPVLLPARPVRKAPKSPRIVADRVFMDAKEAPQADEGDIAAAIEFYSC
jgi:hypothetical protein